MSLTTARLTLVFSVLLFFPLCLSLAEVNTAAPHGFDFGMSRKAALSRAGSLGLEVVSDSKYSKELRKVVLRRPAPDAGPLTLLEFYDDELMSSSLVLSFEDGKGFASARNRLEGELRGNFGESFKSDRVFSYEVLRWELADILVLLSLNPDRKTVKLEYVNRSVLGKKTAKDLERKRRDDPGDPAKEMFIDGDYSAR